MLKIKTDIRLIAVASFAHMTFALQIVAAVFPFLNA